MVKPWERVWLKLGNSCLSPRDGCGEVLKIGAVKS